MSHDPVLIGMAMLYTLHQYDLLHMIVILVCGLVGIVCCCLAMLCALYHYAGFAQ
jgi:hypothetical protein